MSFEIFLNISFKNQPIGAHQKFERPSPALGFLFKKSRPMGWAELGLAQPIRSSGLYIYKSSQKFYYVVKLNFLLNFE